MAAQNPNYGFSNNEGEVAFATTATATYHGDVILQNGGIGVVHGGLAFDPIPASTQVSLRVRGVVTGMTKLTGVAWSSGDQLYWDPTNLGFTNSPTLYPAGMALTAQVSGDTTASVLLNYCGRGSLIGSAAPVTAITGSSEAAAATIDIPAGLLNVGDIIEVEANLAATAQNSTDTLEVRLRIGTVAGVLTGTVIGDTGAVQCAAGVGISVRTRLQITAVSATVGAMAGSGLGVANATSKNIAAAPSSLNTTAALAIAVTTAFSSSSAGDTVNLNAFTVRRIG